MIWFLVLTDAMMPSAFFHSPLFQIINIIARGCSGAISLQGMNMQNDRLADAFRAAKAASNVGQSWAMDYIEA